MLSVTPETSMTWSPVVKRRPGCGHDVDGGGGLGNVDGGEGLGNAAARKGGQGEKERKREREKERKKEKKRRNIHGQKGPSVVCVRKGNQSRGGLAASIVTSLASLADTSRMGVVIVLAVVARERKPP